MRLLNWRRRIVCMRERETAGARHARRISRRPLPRMVCAVKTFYPYLSPREISGLGTAPGIPGRPGKLRPGPRNLPARPGSVLGSLPCRPAHSEPLLQPDALASAARDELPPPTRHGGFPCLLTKSPRHRTEGGRGKRLGAALYASLVTRRLEAVAPAPPTQWPALVQRNAQWATSCAQRRASALDGRAGGRGRIARPWKEGTVSPKHESFGA